MRHDHIVDIKSSKLVIIFVVLSIVILDSLTGNIYQIQKINRMNDKDIKYRYIRSTNGISPENLDKLEDIFHYQRDKNVVKKILETLNDFEYIINEAAE